MTEKQSELDKHKKRCREVLKHSSLVAYILDTQGKFVYLNKSGEELFGYSEKEILGKKIFSFVTPTYREALIEQLNKLSPHQIKPIKHEFQILGKSKKTFWLDCECTPIVENGKIQGVFGLTRDISSIILTEKEKEKLGKDLIERNRYLFILNSISTTLNKFMDLKLILNNALDVTLNVLEIDTGIILLFNEEKKELNLRASRHLSQQMTNKLLNLSVDNEVVSRVFKTKQPLVLEDVSHISSSMMKLLKEEGYSTFVAIPLMAKEKFNGMLKLATKAPRKFSSQDKELFSMIGKELGNAIENSRLYEETKKNLDEIKMFHEVVLSVAADLDLEKRLNIITDKANKFLKTDETVIRLIDEEKKELLTAASIGLQSKTLGEIRLKSGEGICGWVAENGEPLIVNDLSKDGRLKRLPLEGKKPASMLCVPLKIGERVIGAISCASSKPRIFNEEDGEALSTIANQAAIAIENARLYEDTKRRVQELSLLYETGSLLSSSLDLNTILDLALTRIGVPGTTFSISLYHEKEEKFEIVAVRGTKKDQILKGSEIRTLAFPKGEMDNFLLQKRNIVIPDTDSIPQSIKKTLAIKESKSLAIIPIISKDKLIGVLSIADVEYHPFSEEELNLLKSIANQVGMAIENARLFEETKKKMGEMKLLYEAGSILTSTLDFKELMHKIVEKFATPDRTAHILLLSDDKSKLIMSAIDGPYQKITEGTEILIEDIIQVNRAKVFEEKRYLIATDMNKATEKQKRILGIENAKSAFVLPLVSKGEVIGIFALIDWKYHHYTDDEIQMYTILGDHIATAIENARLFEDEKEHVAKLKELDETKSEFLSMASHELLTPLSTIIGFTSILMDKKRQITDEIKKESLEAIVESAARLERLTDDLLMVSRIEKGSLELNLKYKNIESIINKVIKTFKPINKEHTFRLEIEQKLPSIYFDNDRIEQVIINLVGNAVKYSPNGGEILIKARRRDDYLLVSLTDQGVGISQEQIERIFERFHRHGKVAVAGKVVRGIGLGLYISKRIIEAHQGRIWAESKGEGMGSTFILTLPLKQRSVREKVKEFLEE